MPYADRKSPEARRSAVEATRRWRERNPEKVKAYSKAYTSSGRRQATRRRWADANRERTRASNRAWYEANRARAVLAERHWKYGLAPERFTQIWDSQNGLCAICQVQLKIPGAEGADRSLSPHVDHDHRCCSGKYSCGGCVRGLLCGYCNRGLGAFADDPGRLQAAADYMQQYPAGWWPNDRKAEPMFDWEG